MATKVQNKEVFVKAWSGYIQHLYLLGYSLPSDKLIPLKACIERLEQYVKIASDHTYAKKPTKPQSQLAGAVVQ